MKNLLLIFIATITFVSLSFTAEAQWTKLGQRKVNFRADHDEILVTAYEGTFRKLKLSVVNAPIFVRNVKIVYGNGNTTNIRVNRKIEKNSDSAALDLPGNKRIIKKVIFNYKSVPSYRGKASVVLFGKR
jgi:hypothetical protein